MVKNRKRSGRMRPTTRRKLLTALFMLAALAVPLVSLIRLIPVATTNHNATVVQRHQSSGFSGDLCPASWSRERCAQRQQEFQEQLGVEEAIRNKMIASTRQRARNRPQPDATEKANQEYYRKVKEVVAEAAYYRKDAPVAWKNFTNNSFADLSIVGFPKAGTSQLYKLLITHLHNKTESVVGRKEFCIDHRHFLDYTAPANSGNPEALIGLQKKLFQYHKKLLNKRTQHRTEPQEGVTDLDPRPLLVNACLQTPELDYHWAYAGFPESSRFLLLFRDPADWLWASWNFWHDKFLDEIRPVDHDWATEGLHYRSPELFHEIILSMDKTKTAAKRFRAMRHQTVQVPRRLLHIVDRSKLLFLKNEDMQGSSGKLPAFLDRLAAFTGLDAAGFDPAVVHGHTNCNAQKGADNLCNGTRTPGYEITENRGMLEETRTLIYLQFWEECKVWADEFGIEYPECLQVIPS